MFSLFINNISFFSLAFVKSSWDHPCLFFLIQLYFNMSSGWESDSAFSFYENKICWLLRLLVTSCASKLLNFQFENSFSRPLLATVKAYYLCASENICLCSWVRTVGRTRYFSVQGDGVVWVLFVWGNQIAKFLPSIQVRGGCALKILKEDLFMFSL